MAEFADGLGSAIMVNSGGTGDTFSGTPGAIPLAPRVADKTGLTGKYDFTFEFGLPKGNDLTGGGPTVPDAVQKLGLKLVKTANVPVDVLVIDHVDKTPTGN
jgi:uncharacterized protein (TIGR03435 family)